MGRRRAEAADEPGRLVGVVETRVSTRAIKGSRKLGTVGPQSEFWGLEKLDLRVPQGMILRLQPPPGKEAMAEEAARLLLKGGAAAVRIDRQTAPRAVPQQQARQEEAPQLGQRELVMRMADEANTQDRAALKAVLEEALGKAGL